MGYEIIGIIKIITKVRKYVVANIHKLKLNKLKLKLIYTTDFYKSVHVINA